MERFEALLCLVRGMGPLALAFSGGLDSRFLAHAILAAACDVVALTAVGGHVPALEISAAREWAAKRGLRHELLPVDVLQVPEVAANSRERCYGCKREVFTRLRDAAGERVLVDGTHAGDAQAFRPGIRALRELGVQSPLALAGLNKADIRKLARLSGLDAPDQAARPCLLTRFDYGLRPDADQLARLAGVEAALAALELGDFRVRLVAGKKPAVQLLAEPGRERRARLEAIMAAHGFFEPRLVLTATISGYFDGDER